MPESEDEQADGREKIGTCENPGCRKPVYDDQEFIRLQHGVLHYPGCTARGEAE